MSSSVPRRIVLAICSLLVVNGLANPAMGDEPARKPNVLFIAIDDLRDWVGYLGHKQVKTPNLDRLAARGVAFTRSYCIAPVCNPSRTALLTGMRPGSTGVYDNQHDWRKLIPADVVRLPQHFKASGYHVATAGKIWHGGYPAPASDWDDQARKGGKGERARVAEEKRNKKPSTKDETWGFGNFRIGPTRGDDADMPDHATVDYCLKQLQKKHDKPFFLACGIVKPHLAFSVPKKYFDLYPLDRIELPRVKADDLNDIPPAGLRMAKPNGDHKTITEAGKWKEAVRAYLATITFCDAMIGRLIDGFDKSAYKDNTIIVLWSDHGWHLGEKQHWRKFALWEEATRSPLIWIVPGLTKPKSVCERTVDFLTIYPTLCDLCGLPTPRNVQGESIRSLLENPRGKWDKPAITTYGFQNHTVRTEKWRYIRYANGDEELYDHDTDPHEWTNLARDEKYARVKKELAVWLPKENKADTIRGK
jgi:arylsulfatase A-like enzyme